MDPPIHYSRAEFIETVRFQYRCPFYLTIWLLHRIQETKFRVEPLLLGRRTLFSAAKQLFRVEQLFAEI